MRVLYNNYVDSATITASSTANATTTPTTNLATDIKSRIWRSGTATGTALSAYLLADLGSSKVVNSIVLCFTNLTPFATIAVAGYSVAPTLGGTVDAPTATGGTQVWSVSAVTSAPSLGTSYTWGTNLNSYEFGKDYHRVHFAAQAAARYILVTITNNGNFYQYIQASRLLIGNAWEPSYGSVFGMSSAYEDTSTSQRSEAGDLITITGTKHSVMSFDLEWMADADRAEFNRLARTAGTSKGIYVSLFPILNTGTSTEYGKEQQYQIYGKQSRSLPVTHPMYEFFSASCEIEEI